MKRLILVLLAVLFLAGTASAVKVSWKHSGQNTTGFTIYFWQTNIPNTVYNASVDVSKRELTIDDNRFIPGTHYSFMGRAFNATATSADSETVGYLFEGEPYDPPDDSLPDEQNPEPPDAPDGMKLESALFKYVPK